MAVIAGVQALVHEMESIEIQTWSSNSLLINKFGKAQSDCKSGMLVCSDCLVFRLDTTERNRRLFSSRPLSSYHVSKGLTGFAPEAIHNALQALNESDLQVCPFVRFIYHSINLLVVMHKFFNCSQQLM